jgi:alpha,alpha-trehalose phosphorylase
MLHRLRLERPKFVYPDDEWRLVESRFYPDLLAESETFFATANGYLGLRGSFEEGEPAYQAGTFVNGFYESWPIVYGEEAYGFARYGQTIVDVPDAKVIKLYVDDEPFYLPTARLRKFERALDMRSGTLNRDVLWETDPGKQVSIKSCRLVSFPHRHLAAIAYEVTVLDAEAPVVIASEVATEHQERMEDDDPRRAKGFRDEVLVPELCSARERRIMLGLATRTSGMTLACGVDHTIETDCEHASESEASKDRGRVVFTVSARPGVPIRIVKYITYHTSRRAAPQELGERAQRTLDRSVAGGFETLRRGQREYMDEFWRTSDVRIAGDTEAQQAIRFNLFQILQASGRAEGVGIPAKGLTGQGYEGHYFWDTEIYVLPFLIYTAPRIACNLLKFRHSYLDKARTRAREVNQRGALFPWRTINGDEASANYAAGTAQYHINADIAYAVKKYVDVTGDEEFLRDYGAEMLIETARLWVDLGFYSERRDGQFCIHGVTGPDEYNTVVNNNTYTNLMARENLRYAARSVEWLRDTHPEQFKALSHRTGLAESEIEEWRRAGGRMYIPFDEETGVHPQDDAFMDREPWDFENAPPDKYPLLLHHHPLVIYRHRVIKQADVVLAMSLLGHEFSHDQKKRNYDYYDPLTTGDSSLSVSIQGILASELGYTDKASEYARHSALMDLGDVGGNARDGCHIASMGGTWMVLAFGLAGLRDWDGKIGFDPKPPKRVAGLSMPLRIRGRLLQLDLEEQTVTYTLKEGDDLVFRHRDEEIRLTAKQAVAVRPYEGSRGGGD